MVLAFASFAFTAEAQTPTAPVTAAPAPATTDWLSYKNPYADSRSLATPHRTNDEITAWAQETAADTLTFGPSDYRERFAAFKKTYFSAPAWQLYSDYLRNSKTINMVTDNGYSVATIVSNPPDLVNQGPTGGVYHWIVKVPITVSNYGTGSDGVIRSAVNGQYILYMDIMRAGDSYGDALIINNWRVDNLPVAAVTP